MQITLFLRTAIKMSYKSYKWRGRQSYIICYVMEHKRLSFSCFYATKRKTRSICVMIPAKKVWGWTRACTHTLHLPLYKKLNTHTYSLDTHNILQNNFLCSKICRHLTKRLLMRTLSSLLIISLVVKFLILIHKGNEFISKQHDASRTVTEDAL